MVFSVGNPSGIVFLIRLSLSLAFFGPRFLVLAKSMGSSHASMSNSVSEYPEVVYLENMPISLPGLPYQHNALEPYISERTLQIHHGKHHAKYVEVANNLIKGTELEGKDVVEVTRSAFNSQNQGLFNNAGQCFNHAFYWENMKAGGGGQPPSGSRLMSLVETRFGTFASFRAAFVNSGMTAFGSGWAWLVYSHKTHTLEIVNSIGANGPITNPDQSPLLVCDVWEHAYYLDYQNMRATYLDVFMDKLVSWDMVQERLDSLLRQQEPQTEL